MRVLWEKLQTQTLNYLLAPGCVSSSNTSHPAKLQREMPLRWIRRVKESVVKSKATTYGTKLSLHLPLCFAAQGTGRGCRQGCCLLLSSVSSLASSPGQILSFSWCCVAAQVENRHGIAHAELRSHLEMKSSLFCLSLLVKSLIEICEHAGGW